MSNSQHQIDLFISKDDHTFVWRCRIHQIPEALRRVADLVHDDRLDFDWDDAYQVCESLRLIQAQFPDEQCPDSEF